jgi:hypothetical protein
LNSCWGRPWSSRKSQQAVSKYIQQNQSQVLWCIEFSLSGFFNLHISLGETTEPFEQVHLSVPTEFSGVVVDMLNKRKGEMLHMLTIDDGTASSSSAAGSTELVYSVPTRGLVGIRSALLTVTKGTGNDDVITDSLAFYLICCTFLRR